MRPTLLAGAVCASLTLATLPVAAQPLVAPNSARPSSDLELARRTFYKSLSYETLSSVDDFAFGYIFGGSLAAGGLLVLANVASELAVNYAHDLTWSLANRSFGASEADTRLVRTATYTGANTVRAFGLGFLVSGNAGVAGGYVAFNAAVDGVVYAANDALWGYFWPVDAAPSNSPPQPSAP